MNETRPEQVLDFWFGPAGGDAQAARRRWFAATDDDDAQISRRFGPALAAAAAGKLEHWCRQARGRLAFIIVCDQFSRNIHRGSARAFATDARALEQSLAALETGEAREFSTDERAFALMPLEHSEETALQARSVTEFERLLADAGATEREACERYLQHAREHQAIIARFGRFPNRNAALGRTSTAAEQAWLDGGGSAFGGQVRSPATRSA